MNFLHYEDGVIPHKSTKHVLRTNYDPKAVTVNI
jgi:hypothetical protein